MTENYTLLPVVMIRSSYMMIMGTLLGNCLVLVRSSVLVVEEYPRCTREDTRIGTICLFYWPSTDSQVQKLLVLCEGYIDSHWDVWYLKSN